MKTTTPAIPRPPLVAACPWCDGDVDVDVDVTRCEACDVELHVAVDRTLAVAA